MSDPFLAAHRVLPSFYLIGFPVSPISIRDQIVRGCLVIQRAFEQSLIAPDDPILVVGAGAGGASAAIRAAELGAHVTLVDLAPGPFAVQAGVNTRWLDPTQYDWPAGHWATSRYAWDPLARVPLDYPADWASGLAARWAIALHAAARRHAGCLRIRYGTRVASIIPTGARPNLDVTFNPPMPPPDQFTFLLWATGFGKETCDVSPPGATPYRGPPFWGNDPFTQANCGLTSPTPPRVLISGSGDGALQDFLRVLTKRESAEDIYRECRIPQTVADRLWDAEERAQRQMLWANGLRHEHVVHDWLEKEHEAAVKDALPRPEVQAGLARLLSHNIEPITLVYRCNHLTPQYGLNRFLTLLLARYLEEKHPRSSVTLLMEKSVVRVSGHACTGPVACHGKHHEVELEEYPQCWKPPGARVPAPLDADVLIIRHGIDRAGIVAPLPSALKSFLQLERAKHLLPYHPRP